MLGMLWIMGAIKVLRKHMVTPIIINKLVIIIINLELVRCLASMFVEQLQKTN